MLVSGKKTNKTKSLNTPVTNQPGKRLLIDVNYDEFSLSFCFNLRNYLSVCFVSKFI